MSAHGRRSAAGVAALLIAFATVGAAAQEAAPAGPARPARPGLIATHAEARRRLPNTVADASVSIEVHGRDLRGTATQLGRQAQALLVFLRGQPAERLRTEGTRFEPEIQELRGQPDRIKGYTGRITVSFRTSPDQLPFLLAGCLDNGATALGQFGSSPREEEVTAARRELVEEASRAAIAQARAVAEAVGQRLAGVELVEVDPSPGTGADRPGAAYAAERAAPMARPVVPPIASEAGDTGLSVSVFLTVRVAAPGAPVP